MRELEKPIRAYFDNKTKDVNWHEDTEAEDKVEDIVEDVVEQVMSLLLEADWRIDDIVESLEEYEDELEEDNKFRQRELIEAERRGY